MSSLLPLFATPQNGPNAIGGGGSATEPLSQVSQDQAIPSGQAFATAFSQILHEHHQNPAFLKHQDFRNLEILVGPDAVEKILDELQVFGGQGSPEEPHLPISISDVFALPSIQGTQASVNGLLPSHAFQSTGGVPALGAVRQDLQIEGNFLGKAQVPQGREVKPASSQEEVSLLRTIVHGKDVSSGLPQVGRLAHEEEALKAPILQRLSSPLARSQAVQPHHTAPVTAIQAEGPAGFTEPGLTNQILVKSIPGNSSVLNDVAGSGIEHRTSVPTDLLGESGLLSKGDRVQTILETSVKNVGLDPSGGQGLGSSMNHSSNSQAGFQQSSSFPGQGVGLRALEARGQELPTPALQRLQMDVQLSETQRVQIDVGVQNRQVYAGLVMDHSVLRNLANQFVPQLENQLTQVDLELQEFSAEVREEHEQEAHMLFDDSRSHEGQMPGRHAQGELLSPQNSVSRQKEPGLHLVA